MKIVIGTSTPFHLVHLARELSAIGHEVIVIGYMPKYKMKKYDLGTAKYKCIFWFLFPFSIFALQRVNVKLQMKAVFYIMPLVDFFISKLMPSCDVFIGLSGVNLKSFKIAKEKFNAITICDRGSSHVKSQVDLTTGINSNKFPNIYIDRELKGYSLADYIMLPSQFAFNTFIAKGISINKLLINNYGVDLDRFQRTKDRLNEKSYQSTINALFVGGWSYRKGCDILYSALQKNENLTITHIGTIGELPFPTHERLKSLGHISNFDLPKYYSNFNVFLLPSREDGFGMVLLEALACGLPVIASKNTGAPDIKEVISDNSCIQILEDITPESLLKIINENNSYRANFNQKDRGYFTWSAYGSRYNNFLVEIKTQRHENGY